MRKLFSLVPLIALAACSSGGAGAPVAPTSQSSPAGTGSQPTATYAKPAFTIVIPPRAASNANSRSPKFISSATLSVSIALTSDSAGVTPASLAGNPAITNVSGSACATGCVVNGPPSPPGTDSFTVTTYDMTGAAGKALDTASGTYTIGEGTNNSETIVLAGIPGSITFGTVAALAAGTSASGSITNSVVVVKDADGQAITGTYANAVTITDPDTNGDGTYVVSSTGSCPTYPTGNTAQTAATSATLTSSTATALFCYGGIAEAPVTLTASASGVTSSTASFQPTLSSPVYTAGSATPTGVTSVTAGVPDIALFAASGLGSTGSAKYTEKGWSEAPFDQALAASAGLCAGVTTIGKYATVSTSTASNATTVTATALSSGAVAGSCTTIVGDGLTTNTTDSPASLKSSYTTSQFNGS